MKNKILLGILAIIVIFSAATAARADLTSITVNAPADSASITGTYTLNATLPAGESADNITFYYYDLYNGSDWVEIGVTNGTTYDWDTTTVYEGWYRYDIAAIADNGTVQVNNGKANITIDNSIPALSNVNIQNGTWIKGNKTISFDVTEGTRDTVFISTNFIGVRWNGFLNCSKTGNIEYCQTEVNTNGSNGNATFWIGANDSIGNEVLNQYNVTFDNIAPQMTNFSMIINSSAVEKGYGLSAADFNCTATDNLGTITYNITGLDTSSTGIKTATCTATDQAGNSNSSALNYTIVDTTTQNNDNSCSSCGGSSGSGGGGSIIIKPGESTTIDIDTGRSFVFSTGTDTHTLRVTGTNNNSADITISSNPINSVLEVGSTKNFDLDGNGKNDLGLTLLSINGTIAKVKVNPLIETAAVAQEETKPTEQAGVKIEGKEESKTQDLATGSLINATGKGNIAFFAVLIAVALLTWACTSVLFRRKKLDSVN